MRECDMRDERLDHQDERMRDDLVERVEDESKERWDTQMEWERRKLHVSRGGSHIFNFQKVALLSSIFFIELKLNFLLQICTCDTVLFVVFVNAFVLFIDIAI